MVGTPGKSSVSRVTTVKPRDKSLRGLRDPFAGQPAIILFRKINIEGEECLDIYCGAPQFVQSSRESTRQLVDSHPMGGARPGVN